MKRKPTRGGKRPGAGHPRTTGSGDGPPVSFRISAEDRATAGALAARQLTTVNALARDLFLAMLRSSKP